MTSDMKHLDFIDQIADADTDMLRSKEATYQGSWKKAGGRSAWFMMRRNMDRLLSMMAPPPPHENFRLQNVRDLADNIERAPFSGGRMDVEIHSSVHNYSTDLRYICDSHVAEDIFAKIEERPSGDDGTVLACLRDLRRYLLLIEAEMVSRGIVFVERATTREWKKPDIVENVAVSAQPGSIEIGGTQDLISAGTPEDGGHHEKDNVDDEVIFHYPWVINSDEYTTLLARVGKEVAEAFYNQRAPGIYRLEPIVASDNIPRELVKLYVMQTYKAPLSNWCLIINKVPAQLRDNYPFLQREMNIKEFEESPKEFQFMYRFYALKYLLTEEFTDWGR